MSIMSSLFSKEIQTIKKVFPLVHYCIRSIPTTNSYEKIIHIINKFFEINSDYFEILLFSERTTDLHYCEKDKLLVETTIEVKCKPIINKPLDDVFIQYCGDYKNDENLEKKFNQYKEDYNRTIQYDDLDRNALEFHIYIREFSFINEAGENITKYFVDFNYITKIRTKLFEVTYKKMKEIFNISDLTPENLNNVELYKINYDGELFEEVRIHCLMPFMYQL